MRSTTGILSSAVVVIGIWAFLSGPAAAQEEAPVRYDGFQLWRVIPRSDVELEVLGFIVAKHNLTYWLPPSMLGRPCDVMVPPSSSDQLTLFFKRSFSSFEVLQTDIQRVINEQYVDRALPGESFKYNMYHDLDSINEWIDQMVTDYPDLATKIQIGTSYQNRPMYVIKISVPARGSYNKSKAAKQSIFIEGGIHAREWISPATVIYMTNQLLKQYNRSEQVEQILTAFDWYILPVFNVDGYKYTWAKNRLWRKTRSPTGNPLCKGTDPNRNWDDHWSEEGSSRNPCSETYCGSKAFSEVEVQAVSNFLISGINFVGFIDFHSYSQLWMTPWGWTTQIPDDYYKQNTQSKKCVEALTKVHGSTYEYGTIADTIYKASGNSVDWAYKTAGVLYSSTVELRDMGQYGFLLPANQIIPTGEETFAGLVQYALFIINNGL